MAEVMGLTNPKSCSNGFNAALKKLTGKTAAGLGAASQSDNSTEKTQKPKAAPRKPKAKKSVEPQVKSEVTNEEESGAEDAGNPATQEHAEGSGVSFSKNDDSNASSAPISMGGSSQAMNKGDDKIPTKKGARKAGELADEVKIPAKKRAKKEPEPDAQGNPVKAKRTRKPKLDDSVNVIPPKPRARKAKDAAATGAVAGATLDVQTPGMADTSATTLTHEQCEAATHAAQEAFACVKAMDVVAELAAGSRVKQEHHPELDLPELEHPVQLGEEIEED